MSSGGEYIQKLTISRVGRAISERLSPDLLLAVLVGCFTLSGLFITTTVHGDTPLIEFLFETFMYVGLPTGVLLGIGYLRRSSLPRATWWHVVIGYIAGVVFITVLLLWANAPQLTSGLSLWSLRRDVVFLGNLGGIFGFVAGVTRARATYNRKLRRELERKNEKLNEYADFLVHDLRNPLSVAKGHLEAVEEEVENPHLAEVGGALERMDDLIDDVLTLARAEQQSGERTTVDLGDISRDCWTHVATGGATLNVEATCQVRVDRSQLAQAFENLFRNSIEHGGNEVTVGTLPNGFYVEDDGSGIPDSDIETVFEANFTTSPDGTGFGLRIVEEHGWSVSTSSGSEGGARFEVTGVTADGDDSADV
jgi:signal transduction histidine kinase